MARPPSEEIKAENGLDEEFHFSRNSFNGFTNSRISECKRAAKGSCDRESHLITTGDLKKQIVNTIDNHVNVDLKKGGIKMNKVQDTMFKSLKKEVFAQKQMNDRLQRKVKTLENELATTTTEVQNDLKNAMATAKCAQYQCDILSKGRSETYPQAAKAC